MSSASSTTIVPTPGSPAAMAALATPAPPINLGLLQQDPSIPELLAALAGVERWSNAHRAVETAEHRRAHERKLAEPLLDALARHAIELRGGAAGRALDGWVATYGRLVAPGSVEADFAKLFAERFVRRALFGRGPQQAVRVPILTPDGAVGMQAAFLLGQKQLGGRLHELVARRRLALRPSQVRLVFDLTTDREFGGYLRDAVAVDVLQRCQSGREKHVPPFRRLLGFVHGFQQAMDYAIAEDHKRHYDRQARQTRAVRMSRAVKAA